jgi:hypothetical protein
VLGAEELRDAGGGVEGGFGAGGREDGSEALVEAGIILEGKACGVEAGDGHLGYDIELIAAGGPSSKSGARRGGFVCI